MMAAPFRMSSKEGRQKDNRISLYVFPGWALCLAVGYAAVSWLYGRWVYRLPRLDRLPA